MILLTDNSKQQHVTIDKYTYMKYRVSIKHFPDYKHLLQENYMEYKLPPLPPPQM
jgi:hypothetical protein